jgi:hypothetical protein
MGDTDTRSWYSHINPDSSRPERKEFIEKKYKSKKFLKRTSLSQDINAVCFVLLFVPASLFFLGFD